MPASQSHPIKDELACCIQETEALWKKRQIAIDAPYFALDNLAHLDSRLNARLDTLRQKRPELGHAGTAI